MTKQVACLGLLLATISQPLLADSLYPPLIEAVRQQDSATVRTLLGSGADPNQRYSDGSTALIWAAHNDDLAIVAALLAAGANPLLVNEYGISAYSESAINGNAAILAVLIDAGVDVDALDRNGETALMAAARSGNQEAVRLLLAAGADPNARESWRGQTALMWAAAENHRDIVQLLLDAGAEINAVSREFDYRDLKVKPGSVAMNFPRGGFTALLFAAREGAYESAELLITSGADINLADPDSTSPLLMSIINFNYDIAMRLLDSGADANITDDRGRSPLYAAVDMRRLDTSNRPVPQLTDQHTPLDVIGRLLEIPDLLVDAPLNHYLRPRAVLDGEDSVLSAGATPYMRAARSGDSEVMALLLAAGADPHQTLEDGSTSLMIAAGHGWRDGKSNNTLAATLEAVRISLEQGVDIQASNEDGLTALHSAANRGADEAIRLLVDSGADLHALDASGNTPLDTAKSVGGKLTPLYSTVTLLEELSTN